MSGEAKQVNKGFWIYEDIHMRFTIYLISCISNDLCACYIFIYTCNYMSCVYITYSKYIYIYIACSIDRYIHRFYGHICHKFITCYDAARQAMRNNYARQSMRPYTYTNIVDHIYFPGCLRLPPVSNRRWWVSWTSKGSKPMRCWFRWRLAPAVHDFFLGPPY